MKNSILSILGLLSIISISGQNYFPVVEENKKWNVMYVIFPGSGDTIYWTNTYNFEGDTVINGLNYLKVYKSEEEIPELWTLEGCIREDQDKKVFFNKWGIDYLKYDFGVEIGDTIEISPNYSPLQVLVESIDSVIINGIYRKSILLKDITYSNAHELWIEGVGSNRGILESGTAGYVGGWRWFLCMSQNEELIYMNPNYNTCYLKTTSIEENIKPIIGVYPNPTTDYLWISIPAEMPLEGLTVEVFNTAGLSMTTTRPASHNFSIETGHLPSGLYFVRINTGEKSFTTKFSVKGM